MDALSKFVTETQCLGDLPEVLVVTRLLRLVHVQQTFFAPCLVQGPSNIINKHSYM